MKHTTVYAHELIIRLAKISGHAEIGNYAAVENFLQSLTPDVPHEMENGSERREYITDTLMESWSGIDHRWQVVISLKTG